MQEPPLLWKPTPETGCKRPPCSTLVTFFPLLGRAANPRETRAPEGRSNLRQLLQVEDSRRGVLAERASPCRAAARPTLLLEREVARPSRHLDADRHLGILRRQDNIRGLDTRVNRRHREGIGPYATIARQ
jgi:hypothetical protein